MIKNYANIAFFGFLSISIGFVSLAQATSDFPDDLEVQYVLMATMQSSRSLDSYRLKNSYTGRTTHEYDHLQGQGSWTVNASLKADVGSPLGHSKFSTNFEPVIQGNVQTTSHQNWSYPKEINEYCDTASQFGEQGADFVLTLQSYGTLKKDGTIQPLPLPGTDKILSCHSAIPYPIDQIEADVGKKVGYYANPLFGTRTPFWENLFVPNNYIGAGNSPAVRHYLITWGVYLTQQ